MKYLSFLLCILWISGALSEEAMAQDIQKGLSVSPAFQEISFAAEETQAEFDIVLTNTSGQAIIMRPTVVDFGSLDESGGVAFLGETKDIGQKYALASWMRPEKDTLFLENGETESFRIVIENRDSLSPGGHYAAILFRIGSGEEDDALENSVEVEQMVSVLVLAKKKGGEIYRLGLKETEWSKNPFSLPTEVKLRFQNEGNVHIVPRGVVRLLDPLGREVKRGIINPESAFLLPETLRIYKTSLRSGMMAFLPGWYKLSVEYRYDGEEDFTLKESKHFFLPWPILLFGGGGALGIFFWLRRKKNMALS